MRVLSLIVGLVGIGTVSATEPPNIIFILADDFGWSDWEHNGGEFGSKFFETPALNRMASEGVNFAQAYALPLCSPSRATLMSGQYADARMGLFKAITGGSVAEPAVPASANKKKKSCWPTSRNSLPLETFTIAEALKQNGYATFHFGKWHLGNRNRYPVRQGFDTQRAVKGAGPGVPNGYFAPFQVDDFVQGEEGDYLTDKITDEVLKKIEENQSRPFFMYLAHFNVHSPYFAKENLIQKYVAKSVTQSTGQCHPIMAAMVQSLDESVGRILDKLDELKISRNTLVVFMGDNGGVHFKNGRGRFADVPITVNGPLREGKGTFYEGGVRVPLIVRMPGTIPPGRTENTPVHMIDFYPTFLRLTGETPDWERLDGIDIWNLMTQQGAVDDRSLFCHFPREKQVCTPAMPGGSFIRRGDFKLLRYFEASEGGDDLFELYDIRQDMGEIQNLVDSHPKVVEELKSELDDWLKKTGALIPKANPNYVGH